MIGWLKDGLFWLIGALQTLGESMAAGLIALVGSGVSLEAAEVLRDSMATANVLLPVSEGVALLAAYLALRIGYWAARSAIGLIPGYGGLK